MQTLALDANYSPASILPWQRAMTLLYEEKCETVLNYDGKVVRTVSLVLPLPSVVRFLRRTRDTKRAVKFSRASIWLRDKGRCCFCGAQVRRDSVTYDHVIPRAQGGRTVWENVVASCMPCNQKKRDRTPEQAGMHLRVKPEKPRSLPGGGSYLLSFRPGMPSEWSQWLVDRNYWYSELDHD